MGKMSNNMIMYSSTPNTYFWSITHSLQYNLRILRKPDFTNVTIYHTVYVEYTLINFT